MADFTVGLLAAVVIVLIFIIVVRPRAITGGSTSEYDCVDRATGAITGVTMTTGGAKTGAAAAPAPTAAATPEAKAQAENIEHFESCANGVIAMPDPECACRGDNFDYAVHEYGAPGMGYSDWASSQAVESAVVQNHAEFLRERSDAVQQGIITGRTWALPDHESYQPTPWIGIRGRPTRVPVCNPTRVTDDDIYYFPSAQKLVWRNG